MNASTARPPMPGDVFVIPLTEGRFGAAVLYEAGREFRFVVLDYFWDKVPTCEEALSKGYMSMHEWHSDTLWKGWFKAPFPRSYTLLGKTSFETNQLRLLLKSSGTMVFGTAKRFSDELLTRWRWRFDREALEAEHERQRIEYEEKERKRRENRSLKTMQRERPFMHWADQWPRSVVASAHRIVREAAKDLIALQDLPNGDAQLVNVLKRIVDDFNQLYAQSGCIETEEATDIVDWVEQLAVRVGLSNEDERLTGHRMW